jgi:hypothetical protein
LNSACKETQIESKDKYSRKRMRRFFTSVPH